MKVSLISTMKNEESSISGFLDSLLSQSRLPDEIIIVDGGSTDNTIPIIDSYIKNGAPIELIIENGVNIAKGRNIAITNAKYDIIASTDAGCKINKDWLQNLIKPFEVNSGIGVVSGWYEANPETKFEEWVADATYPKLDRINPDNFLPSSRSIAYKRDAWEKVGGYPEWLYTAEDTLFDINLKKAGYKFVFVPDAVVYWKPRQTLGKILKQYYLYAKGDAEARLFTKYYGVLYIFHIIVVFGWMYTTFSWISIIFPILMYLAYVSYMKIKIKYMPLIFIINLSKLYGYLVGRMKLQSFTIKNNV